MPTMDATLSIRIPSELKQQLEEAAQKTQRSRAFLTIAALKEYLPEAEERAGEQAGKDAMEVFNSYRSIGVEITGKARTIDEIDASIRILRGE